MADTPNFDMFAAKGTHAKYINNTFITKTFPCHYSIATGLFEESHGIIANHMYDRDMDPPNFNMGTTETAWWDGGEPLWVTAQKANLCSATYFWPGSEAKIRGYRPNIYKKYNESIKFEPRVDTVVQWLSADTDFAMLYFHEPDSTGHKYGPNSTEVKTMVEKMDTLLGYVVKKLDDAGLWSSVNVIVTSDHGMTEIDIPNKNIDLLNYVHASAILQAPSLGPVANIMTAPEMIDAVVQNLSNVEHLAVYRRENVPEFWHYSNNRRILDIVAVADEGWTIVKNLSATYQNGKGTHGYDNRLPSMKPIFYARGPNIKPGVEVPPFNSVDIYPLVCELLGIPAAPNNGSLLNTKAFIVYNTNSGVRNVHWLGLWFVSFVLMFCHFSF